MKVSAAKKRTFVDVLVRGQTPAGAAQAIGVDRRTAYRWRAIDPAFAEEWTDARETKIENVETVLYRQAMGGDITAIIFFLKAHRPETYNRRMRISLEGDFDNPLSVTHHGSGEVVHFFLRPTIAMSRRRSNPMKRPSPRRSAEVVPVEVVEALRDAKLCQRGLSGDVDAMIEWLSLFGGDEWRLPSSMLPAHRFRHNPGRR